MNLLPELKSNDTVDLGQMYNCKFKLFHTNAIQALDFGSTIEIMVHHDTRLVLIPADEFEIKQQQLRYGSASSQAVDISGNAGMRDRMFKELRKKLSKGL